MVSHCVTHITKNNNHTHTRAPSLGFGTNGTSSSRAYSVLNSTPAKNRCAITWANARDHTCTCMITAHAHTHLLSATRAQSRIGNWIQQLRNARTHRATRQSSLAAALVGSQHNVGIITALRIVVVVVVVVAVVVCVVVDAIYFI
jgi:hypothetical protein